MFLFLEEAFELDSYNKLSFNPKKIPINNLANINITKLKKLGKKLFANKGIVLTIKIIKLKFFFFTSKFLSKFIMSEPKILIVKLNETINVMYI